MNLFSLLRRDHLRLKAFAGSADLAQAPSRGPFGNDGHASVRRLARQWAIHFLSEENFLFPRLASEAETRELMRSLSEAHAQVREDLRRLLRPDDRGYTGDAAEDLRATLRKTVELEENGLLRKAEELISPEEAESLARDVEDFREELRLTLQKTP